MRITTWMFVVSFCIMTLSWFKVTRICERQQRLIRHLLEEQRKLLEFSAQLVQQLEDTQRIEGTTQDVTRPLVH